MKTLHIIAGAPGSGKSTMAKVIAQGYRDTARVEHYEADMYFVSNGIYKFDPTLISNAHAWCQNKVLQAMLTYCPIVIVSNTFTKAWERKHYLELAAQYGYAVVYTHCTGAFDNVHGVPDEVVTRMRDTYEPFSPLS